MALWIAAGVVPTGCRVQVIVNVQRIEVMTELFNPEFHGGLLELAGLRRMFGCVLADCAGGKALFAPVLATASNDRHLRERRNRERHRNRIGAILVQI
jgi:hypothetical protein